MKKMLVIVGPTASGKTALALDLAKLYKGYLLSADSRQVYKGLDIISGKDIPSNTLFIDESHNYPLLSKKYKIGYYLLQDIPIYLLDLVSPTYNFSVHDYLMVSQDVLTYKKSDQALPILVGGSGFYINSLLYGIETVNIPQDKHLRIGLENASVPDLVEILKKLNPKKFNSMNESDSKNPVRLIRAIEVAQFGNLDIHIEQRIVDEFKTLIIGLKMNRMEIKRRIDVRVDKRIKQGAFEEAENLFNNYKNLSNGVKSANGYKQLFEYFKGDATKEEAIQKWRTSEYLNAKKQMTWFKKDKNIQWFDVEDPNMKKQIDKLVKVWLTS